MIVMEISKIVYESCVDPKITSSTGFRNNIANGKGEPDTVNLISVHTGTSAITPLYVIHFTDLTDCNEIMDANIVSTSRTTANRYRFM